MRERDQTSMRKRYQTSMRKRHQTSMRKRHQTSMLERHQRRCLKAIYVNNIVSPSHMTKRQGPRTYCRRCTVEPHIRRTCCSEACSRCRRRDGRLFGGAQTRSNEFDSRLLKHRHISVTYVHIATNTRNAMTSGMYIFASHMCRYHIL